MIVVYDKRSYRVLGFINPSDYEIKTKLDKRKKQLGFSKNSALYEIDEKYIPEEALVNPSKYFFFPDAGITSKFVLDLGQLKLKKKQEIKEEMYKAAKMGFCSPTIKAKVNAERHDLDNLKNLYDYCSKNNISSIQIRLYDNSFKEVTLTELEAIIDEVVAFGLQLYQTKWQLEQQIEQATTEEELQNIFWPLADQECEETVEEETGEETSKEENEEGKEETTSTDNT